MSQQNQSGAAALLSAAVQILYKRVHRLPVRTGAGPCPATPVVLSLSLGELISTCVQSIDQLHVRAKELLIAVMSRLDAVVDKSL